MADGPRHVFTPTVFYCDPRAAIDWLQQAFGFEISLLMTDEQGNIGHCELSFDGAPIGIAGEWSGEVLGPAKMQSPARLGGACTQFVWIKLAAGLDEHAARAAAAGARLTQQPQDQFYGARTYRALDLEGHVWCFSQDVKAVSDAEMEAASGLRVRTGAGA